MGVSGWRQLTLPTPHSKQHTHCCSDCCPTQCCFPFQGGDPAPVRQPAQRHRPAHTGARHPWHVRLGSCLRLGCRLPVGGACAEAPTLAAWCVSQLCLQCSCKLETLRCVLPVARTHAAGRGETSRPCATTPSGERGARCGPSCSASLAAEPVQLLLQAMRLWLACSAT